MPNVFDLTCPGNAAGTACATASIVPGADLEVNGIAATVIVVSSASDTDVVAIGAGLAGDFVLADIHGIAR